MLALAGILSLASGLGCDKSAGVLSSVEPADSLPTEPGFSEEVETVLSLKMELVEKLAADPAIVDRVRAANLSNEDLSTAERLQLDRQWRETKGFGDFVKPFVTSPCAELLMKFQETHDGFPEVFVTDRHGLIVAATNKTSDYYQADEAWWLEAFADGQGRSHYSQIEYDESAHSESISLNVPVIDPETNRAIGVVKAVCNITAIKMEL